MLNRKKHPKNRPNDEFNAIYDAIRNSQKHPEVKPVQGRKIDYREQ